MSQQDDERIARKLLDLGSRSDRVQIRNGITYLDGYALGNGTVEIRSQVARDRRRRYIPDEVKKPIIVFCLDSNWLEPLWDTDSKARQFCKAVLKTTGATTVTTTLRSDSRLFRPLSVYSILTDAMNSLGITLNHTSLEFAEGFIYVPLFKQDGRLTEAEAANVKAQCLQHGGFIVGERFPFKGWNESILAIFDKIGWETNTTEPPSSRLWQSKGLYGTPSGDIIAGAGGWFINGPDVDSDEVLATANINGATRATVVDLQDIDG
jgi:hypothetical protein